MQVRILSRKKTARAKLTTVRAVVELILPKPVGDAVRAVEASFWPPYDNDEPYIDFLENENKILSEATDQLRKTVRAHKLSATD